MLASCVSIFEGNYAFFPISLTVFALGFKHKVAGLAPPWVKAV
jgi:hypothetical protein